MHHAKNPALTSYIALTDIVVGAHKLGRSQFVCVCYCNEGAANPMQNGLPGLTGQYATILADPPWQFLNRTGKMAPEHKRLHRYHTMKTAEICALPVARHAAANSHLYLWVPNALLQDGLAVMRAWGFQYKTNVVWYKIRKDGGPDGRGVGFYFRNVTELVLFGIRGRMRTLKPGRTQVNLLKTRKQEHSRKPDEFYDLIEQCSPAPYLELFARTKRRNWVQWGDQIDDYEEIRPQHRGYSRAAVPAGYGEQSIFSLAIQASA